MSAFCRIKVEDVETVSNLALARGLEHNIMPFEGNYKDWVTIQLTNDRGRRAFENLCAENGVIVDGTQIVHRMMDNVLEGVSAERVIDEALKKQGWKYLGVDPDDEHESYKKKVGDVNIHVYRFSDETDWEWYIETIKGKFRSKKGQGKSAEDAMSKAEKFAKKWKGVDEALTKGMKNVMSKNAKYKCGDCGLSIPKYQGRYPKFCPECGGELTPPKERPAD